LFQKNKRGKRGCVLVTKMKEGMSRFLVFDLTFVFWEEPKKSKSKVKKHLFQFFFNKKWNRSFLRKK
jgi:hypothetical protein